MKIVLDTHAHTIVSGHAYNTIREMAQMAKEKGLEAVSYTHLDVYKRQILIISCLSVFVLTKPITILGGMEKESADMCIHMTMWITIVKPLVWIMAFIPGYGMRAAGDVKFSMLTSCTTMWLCRFCLSVFMIRIVGVGAMRCV